MAIEYTFSIIKPDAVEKNITGKINQMIEDADLEIAAQKMLILSPEMAAAFYSVHSDKPFFNDLVEFMCSGPVVVQVLKGESAISKYREVMGATNPKEAAEGTIRNKFSDSIEANSVHGSDSIENAELEIGFFFAEYEIVK